MTPHTERALGFWDLLSIGLNAIVGSSIFLFPGMLAAQMGPASTLAFAWTGLLLIGVGLCYAEASSHYKEPGGAYLYARDAFGEWTGFSVGWLSWVVQVLSWAAVANAIAVYLGTIEPNWGGPRHVKAVAAAAVVGLGLLNFRGVKLGAWASDFFTAAKLVPLAVFLAAGLWKIKRQAFVPFAPQGLKPLARASFLVYFAYQGFESIPVPSGEAKSPGRNVPLAVVLSLVFSAMLYTAIQAVAVGVDPALAGSTTPLADAARIVLGPRGALLLAAGAVLSTFGYNAGSALVTPRYLLALSEDGHIPKWFAHIHPRYHTPFRAILATAATTLVLALFFDFEKLVGASNVVVSAQYLATCLAVPVLRRKKLPAPGAFRLPGSFLIPAAGALAVLWLGSQAAPREYLGSIYLLAAGLLLKTLTGKKRRES